MTFADAKSEGIVKIIVCLIVLTAQSANALELKVGHRIPVVCTFPIDRARGSAPSVESGPGGDHRRAIAQLLRKES